MISGSLARTESCSALIKNDFPLPGNTFRSGSTKDENCRVKSFKPAKPERTMNSEAEPTTMPNAAIIVMMLIALFLLLENR